MEKQPLGNEDFYIKSFETCLSQKFNDKNTNNLAINMKNMEAGVDCDVILQYYTLLKNKEFQLKIKTILDNYQVQPFDECK